MRPFEEKIKNLIPSEYCIIVRYVFNDYSFLIIKIVVSNVSLDIFGHRYNFDYVFTVWNVLFLILCSIN